MWGSHVLCSKDWGGNCPPVYQGLLMSALPGLVPWGAWWLLFLVFVQTMDFQLVLKLEVSPFLVCLYVYGAFLLSGSLNFTNTSEEQKLLYDHWFHWQLEPIYRQHTSRHLESGYGDIQRLLSFWFMIQRDSLRSTSGLSFNVTQTKSKW